MNPEKKSKKLSIVLDFLSYILSLFVYLLLRIKIFVFYTLVFLEWVVILSDQMKDKVVQRMFWGRSTFYRSAFQFAIGMMTFIIAVSGLTGRLNLFSPDVPLVLAFPAEELGDADYMDEGASMQAIVATTLVRNDFNSQTYIVQRGDTLASIALQYEVSTDTIRWANGITGDYIKVGQELKILPIPGVRHVVKSGDTLDLIAEKYEASVQDIYDINWLDSQLLKEGQELLVPNGRMPQPKPVIVPGPVATVPIYTPPSVVYVGDGSFVRPCGCGYISNRFSAWHGAVDIAGGAGCQIVAADSGVVTMARWYGNGGLQVMINHGNGFATLYAHNAAIYVKEGQAVTRGQPIGFMGSTGHSTGVHLHFGVQLNGIWRDPRIYVPI